jgi:hypothetical protein
MAVRNFHLDAAIDGRRTNVTGGPASEDGGFELEVKVRERGEPVTGLRVFGEADDEDGTLRLRVYDAQDREVLREEFER